MSESLRREAEELFQRAVDLPAGERSAFIQRACASRPELALEVQALVRLFENDSGTFLAGSLHAPSDVHLDPMLPEQIGPYRIIRVIGEGGMGVVCEATRENPRRTVALKLVRPGMASASILRRFRREADVLAQLQHPGVAQVYDAGTARVQLSDGSLFDQSYFAMELIHGQPLTAYCEARKLTTRERLDVIARVADAVQYAHQKGVVHRDLKPANIYVNEEGQSKVLDFGVARILNSEMSLAVTQTAAGQIIGTLPYMSPEQVSGDFLQIDTRCDVYSLGVVMFETLTGRLPLEVRDRPIAEAARIIRDQEPRRLTSINPMLRGDIANIVAKALEKDRARRYDSAGELAADIRRYLRDEPIQARPATATYLLRKFARRHRALVAGSAIGVAALVAAVILSSWWAVIADRARKSAESKTREVQREQERAEGLAYRANVAAAAAALENHDASLARSQLEAAPPGRRGWEWHHLRSRIDQSAMVIPIDGQLDHLFWLGFSADDSEILAYREIGGTLVASGWSCATGVPIAAVSTDCGTGPFASRRLSIVPPVRETMRICDREAGQTQDVRRSEWGIAEDAAIHALAGAPMRRRVAVVHDLPPLAMTVVDLDSGQRWNHSIRFDLGPRCDVAENGAIAIAAAEDGFPEVWFPESDRRMSLQGHTDVALTISFSPDGQTVVSGSKDRTLRRWETATGRLLNVGRGHADQVGLLAFSPDGQRVASFSFDRTVRIWDAATLELRATYYGHLAAPAGLSYSHDGTRVVTAATDGTIRTWDGWGTNDPAVLRGHTSYVYAVAVSSDGRQVASAGWDGQIIVRNAEAPSVFLRVPDGFVYNLAFSPDDRHIAAGSDDGKVRVWSLSNPDPIAEVAARSTLEFAFDVSGANLILPGGDMKYDLWNFESGDARAVSLNELHPAPCARYAPKAGLLASCTTGKPGAHRTLEVLDLNTGQRLWRRDAGWTAALSVNSAESESPRLIAIDGEERTSVFVSDARTGAELARLRGHTDEVLAVAWSPDGRRIATGGRDQVVRLWDAQTYEEIVRLRGHTSYIIALVFSPDGKTLYSGGGDHTVRRWGTDSVSGGAR